MNNNYPQSIDILLEKNDSKLNNTLYIIKKHAIILIKINNYINNILPIELKSWCRVVNYRQNYLILEVINTSRKIKLNYELPIIIKKLRNNMLPSLSFIKIKINPLLISSNFKDYYFNK